MYSRAPRGRTSNLTTVTVDDTKGVRMQVSKELPHDDIRILSDKPQVPLVEPLLEDIVVGRYATVLPLVDSWRHVPHEVYLKTKSNYINAMAKSIYIITSVLMYASMIQEMLRNDITN